MSLVENNKLNPGLSFICNHTSLMYNPGTFLLHVKINGIVCISKFCIALYCCLYAIFFPLLIAYNKQLELSKKINIITKRVDTRKYDCNC